MKGEWAFENWNSSTKPWSLNRGGELFKIRILWLAVYSNRNIFGIVTLWKPKKKVQLLWSLWYERNKFTHGGRLKNAGSLLEDIGQWLHIYQQAQINTPPVLAPSYSPLQSWKAPDPGCLKLNVDAFMREGSPTVGLGVGAIIRDESGFVLGAMAKPVPGCFSPFVTECLALREGLIFAADSGLQVQMIETDALCVFAMR